MTITTGDHLSDEVHAIDRDCPHWHAFVSDAGRIWAATTENHAGGSGTTLDAASPVLMRHAIAEQEHSWHCTFGSAA